MCQANPKGDITVKMWFLLALNLSVEGRHWKDLGWGWKDTVRAFGELGFVFSGSQMQKADGRL